jgi:hypothetical protein
MLGQWPVELRLLVAVDWWGLRVLPNNFLGSQYAKHLHQQGDDPDESLSFEYVL